MADNKDRFIKKEADETMLRIAEKIVAQNTKILEMNVALIHALAATPTIIFQERKEKT